MDKEAVLISIQPKWCELIANGKRLLKSARQSQSLKRRLSVISIVAKRRKAG